MSVKEVLDKNNIQEVRKNCAKQQSTYLLTYSFFFILHYGFSVDIYISNMICVDIASVQDKMRSLDWQKKHKCM